jgi:hypothetical protein
MNYSKPEANNLGRAKSVIEQNHTIKGPWAVESLIPPTHCSPAYDLDE